MTPEPKFKIGDGAWCGVGYEHATIVTQCPDCLGTKVWKVTTPAGDEFNLDCGTCASGYISTGTITRWGPKKPYVRALTVGSVRVDTNDRRPVSYMMVETGVGTGSVFYEDQLFGTQEEAMVYAEADANARVEQRNTEAAEREAREKKRVRRKPEWWQRRIKELEKQIGELKGNP